MLVHSQIFEEDIELLTEPQVLLNDVRVLPGGVAIDHTVSLSDIQHACQHEDGRSLPSSIVTQEGKNFILFNREVQIVHRLEVSKHFSQVLDQNGVRFVENFVVTLKVPLVSWLVICLISSLGLSATEARVLGDAVL